MHSRNAEDRTLCFDMFEISLNPKNLREKWVRAFPAVRLPFISLTFGHSVLSLFFLVPAFQPLTPVTRHLPKVVIP